MCAESFPFPGSRRKILASAWQRSLTHTPTHARASTRKGMVRTTPHDHPPPRPQGQRSSLAARSILRIVCLQFIEDDARLQRSHSRLSLPPPPAVNSNCIMAGLVAFWMPIGVGPHLPRMEGYRRIDMYIYIHALCIYVYATQTRGTFHLTCVCVYPLYVYTASRTLTPRQIRTICLIGIIVSVGGDDRAAN